MAVVCGMRLTDEDELDRPQEGLAEERLQHVLQGQRTIVRP